MTIETIDGLRRLLSGTNDSEDIEFLHAILGVHEAFQAAEQLTDELTLCAECGFTWPQSELDDAGACPDCLLERFYERRRRFNINKQI